MSESERTDRPQSEEAGRREQRRRLLGGLGASPLVLMVANRPAFGDSSNGNGNANANSSVPGSMKASRAPNR